MFDQCMTKTNLVYTIPGGLLRFVQFFVIGRYNNIAANHWISIRKYPELQGGLYSPSIATAEQIAARWSSIAYIWTFAVWIPAAVAPPPFNIGFGVFDIVLACYIAVATNYQSGFVPHHKDSCKGSGAHDFQLPPGANESFFEAYIPRNSTTKNPVGVCQFFVEEWQYGIAFVSLNFTIAFLIIACNIAWCSRSYRKAQTENQPFWKTILRGFTEIPLAVCFIIWVYVWMMPEVLFRCLPLPVKSRVRFARRYGVKTGLAVEEKGELQMKELKRKMRGDTISPKGIFQGQGPGAPTDLADFLGVYDMLILVVEGLHHIDITSLSLVSRSVREAVLPANQYAQRMMHFKMYTCHPRSKRQCWVCTNQICDGCRQTPLLRQSLAYYHLEECRPYCTKCYFKTVQAKAPRYRSERHTDARHCKCAPLTPTPNIFQRCISGSQHYAEGQESLASFSRNVCRSCNLLGHVELLKKREKRTAWELKNANRPGTEKCRGCNKVLGGGPRWWVCVSCHKECRSLLHAAWGSSGRKVTGEQAV